MAARGNGPECPWVADRNKMQNANGGMGLGDK